MRERMNFIWSILRLIGIVIPFFGKYF